MRRIAVVLVGALALTLAACGDDDGGGDGAAFCDDIETLSDQIADGELTSDVDDVVDTVNDLVQSVPNQFLDAVENVGAIMEDVDVDDETEVDDAIGEIQDELGTIAEDECDIDADEFAVAPTTTTSTTTEPDETTTTTGPDEDQVDVGARGDIPGDLEPEFAELAENCYSGLAADCDLLYQDTPVGSVAEGYGRSCGGRVDPNQLPAGECATVITTADPVPDTITEPTARDQAENCFLGLMSACDDLFRASSPGTAEQLYGGLCGGRVVFTSAFCVPIFGDTAPA